MSKPTAGISSPTNSPTILSYSPPPKMASRPGVKNPDLFFTNAILSLKEVEKRMQETTLEEWYHTCSRHLLRPLIEIVQSEVVIALGLMATNGILHAYGMKNYGVLREAVGIEEDIRMSEKAWLFPVYHYGNCDVKQNSKMELQLKDWEKSRRSRRAERCTVFEPAELAYSTWLPKFPPCRPGSTTSIFSLND